MRGRLACRRDARIAAASGLLLVGACSHGPSASTRDGGGDAGPGLGVPADRPILDFTGKTASDANAKLLPKGFQEPDPHVCAKDPTRQYLGEIFKYGITGLEVDYHWAPIVPGPKAGLPTLDQPEFSIAGVVQDASLSTSDVLADHPFSLDRSCDLLLDAPYAVLSFESGDPAGGPLLIHPEIEERIFPSGALGYVVAKGDRLLERGVWVLDCGHPPYGAEMHPPSFYAAARAANARTTEAMAVFVPYRSSLLFSQDVTLADAFSNDARFTANGVQPFEQALVTAIEAAVLNNLPNLTAHALMVANRFDTLDFLVCAPLPRPAGATLDATWRFTARTGVTVTATPDEPSGCVHIVATMGSAYSPAPLAHVDAPWPWKELNAEASGQAGQTVDVRQQIINIVKNDGFDPTTVPALRADHPPMIDAYAALATRPGADKDAPVAIDEKADDQAYPFYGRVRAAWKN